MSSQTISLYTHWLCKSSWQKSSINTLWCLLGCSIGDFGTILFFQLTNIAFPIWGIFGLAIVNGIVTSVMLESMILLKQMPFKLAFKTAIGMSLISMVAMELAMNITDYVITGGAMLLWWVIPIMLFFGFIAALPYNYWRLKTYGKSCH